LALASSGIGVTNIYHELLNPHSPHFIRTKELPEGCLGQTYEKLQLMFMKDRPKEILIGLLENSGNSHVAKEMAIRKAQQTPNVAELVSNLTKVKALRFNEPFFGPPQDYIIKEGAMAIVIEKG
jgi:voltage-gated potassium channel